jgi:uncharacterized membrane protein YphA (DoxX/SURF4 family)
LYIDNNEKGPAMRSPNRTPFRVVRAIARVAVAALLLYSGWQKLQQPALAAGFIESVAYVEITPLVAPLAVIEMLVGLWLLVGWRSARAATLAFAAFIGFAVLHGFAGAQPESPPPCGCLGDAEIVKEWPAWAMDHAQRGGGRGVRTHRPDGQSHPANAQRRER